MAKKHQSKKQRKKSNGISHLSKPSGSSGLPQKREEQKPQTFLEDKVKEQKPGEIKRNGHSKEEASATITITVSQPGNSKNPALRSVDGTLTFKLANGRELSNLLELARALEEMADETFSHHVSIGRNDFSSWIKDVFEIEGLAESIKAVPKPEMRAKIYRHLLQELMK